MTLLLITPEINHTDEIELIHAFFLNGLSRLHLRKPGFTTADYRYFLHKIDQQFHSRISIHGSFELLKEFPGLGIHISSRKREEEKIIDIPDAISPTTLSTSFHSWKEVEENKHPFDYVFISPVFDSISKKGYKASIKLSGMIEIKKKMNTGEVLATSIIGLGGIDQKNIELLNKNQFDGVAVLGTVWESANPLLSFLQIQESIKKLGDG